MTNDEVISAVVRFLARVTGVQAIRAHESGRAPSLPYVAVNFTGTAQVRQHARDIEFTDTGAPNGAGETIIRAAPVIEMEWRFSVHAYGSEPTGFLRPVASALELSQAMEPLFPGLVIFDHSAIRSVPEWINNRWEPRAQMDLFVRGIVRDSFEVDVVEDTSLDVQPMA